MLFLNLFICLGILRIAVADVSPHFEEMRSLVLHRVKELQEPEQCRSFLVCQDTFSCGFGCKLHHVAHCLSHAQRENRTMVLPSAFAKFWSRWFLPFSTCQDEYERLPSKSSRLRNAIIYRGDNYDWNANRNYIFDYLKPLINSTSVRHPTAWYMGIFESYLMRFTTRTNEFCEKKREELGIPEHQVFDATIHIRRTDKITSGEGKQYLAREYLREVNHVLFPTLNYFPRDSGNKTLEIFVATDSKEARDELDKYRRIYRFVYNPSGIATAGQASYNKRLRDDEGINNAIFDVEMLSRTKLFVGTFSSQFSRIAFELMALYYDEPSNHAISLDDEWYGRV